MNQNRLFNASKSLLNISKFAGLPLSSDDHQLANNFGAFSTNKINAIRLEIANQVYSPYIRDANGTVTDSTFSEFIRSLRIRGTWPNYIIFKEEVLSS